MPDIKPFRGILFNPDRVKLEDVVAPPYDVITPPMQSYLYERSIFNIVRLVLGRETNYYDSAKRLFEEWRASGVLVREEEPCLYHLEQTFEFEGRRRRRRGIIAACRIEDFGKGSIYPHERTLAKPVKDRLMLFQSTDAMFSQILALYPDSQHRLDKLLENVYPPAAEVEFEGIHNRLSRIADPVTIASFEDYLQGQKAFIADGHHRYETAILHRDLRRLKNPGHTGREGYNFVPMFFTSMNDPDLLVLPTHRILHGLAEFDTTSFLEELKPYFELHVEQSLSRLMSRLTAQKGQAFGLIVPESPRFILMTLKAFNVPFAQRNPRRLPALDVELLHAVILRDILHISEESLRSNTNLEYEQDATKALQRIEKDQAKAVFLLNPTPVEKVRMAAEAGEVLPQKSTFFYPKLLSGLVTYSFSD